MLPPLSLCGDQRDSLLFPMTRGNLLCAIQAKRRVFYCLCVLGLIGQVLIPNTFVFCVGQCVWIGR
jgi:hypothetical protein